MESDRTPLHPFKEETPRVRLRLEHIADWETRVVEARYSPKGLCELCGYSMRHMQRFMATRFKMSLGEFVAAVRMGKAYNLLKRGFSIKETAVGLGFKQVSHFCRSFKQHYRAKPSEVILNTGSFGTVDGSQLEMDFLKAEPPRKKRAAQKDA